MTTPEAVGEFAASVYLADYIRQALRDEEIAPPERSQAGDAYDSLLSLHDAHRLGGVPATREVWETIKRHRPALAQYDPYHTIEPADPPVQEPRKPTDDELGDQLMARWQGLVKFIYGLWFVYSAGVWKPKQSTAVEFWQICIDNKRYGIKPTAGKAASIEKYCQLRLFIEDDQINAGHDYINLRNGVFNLTSGQLDNHRADLYMTTQLPFEFDLFAGAPAWINFLDQVLVQADGTPDRELQALVQQAFYYSLTADTSYRVSFWLIGASGTGKSTLLNVLIALAGDSHFTIDLDTLKDNQYQLADIAGKRVVTFTEPDSRTPLSDGWYKRLVSRDVISARQAYGKPFNFVPICKVWGAMNDTPRVVDRSDAIFGRVTIIPMNHVIPRDQRDGRLDEKLLQELPGIFNWALEGGNLLKQRGGFIQAAQSEAARDEYRMENDFEAQFILDCFDRDPEGRVGVDELYQAYKTWCEANGVSPKNKLRVGRDWRRLQLEQTKSSDGSRRILKGVRLKK